jgi:hypothetical protein
MKNGASRDQEQMTYRGGLKGIMCGKRRRRYTNMGRGRGGTVEEKE